MSTNRNNVRTCEESQQWSCYSKRLWRWQRPSVQLHVGLHTPRCSKADLCSVAKCPCAMGQWHSHLSRFEWNTRHQYSIYLVLSLSTAIQCTTPKSPSNGFISGRSYFYPNVIVYGCDDGFVLNGNNEVRKCNSSGKWSDIAPTCRSKLHYSLSLLVTETQRMPWFRSQLLRTHCSDKRWNCWGGFLLQRDSPFRLHKRIQLDWAKEYDLFDGWCLVTGFSQVSS